MDHRRSIDREAVVRRHVVRLRAPDPRNPLTVGNGEFAFTADVTGLQSFPAFHEPVDAVGRPRPAMRIGTMAQWGFHTSPNPDGWTLDDVTEDWESPRGPVPHPTRYDFLTDPDDVPEDQRAGHWLWVNPHRIDLGRLGLEFSDPARPDVSFTDPSVLGDVDQRLDPWTGLLHSRFRFLEAGFDVVTAVHPDLDAVSVRISSPALADHRAVLRLTFPAPSATFGGTADWNSPSTHESVVERRGGGLVLRRRLDHDEHTVVAMASSSSVSSPSVSTPSVSTPSVSSQVGWDVAGPHDLRVRADGPDLEVVVAFHRGTPGVDPRDLPSAAEVEAAAVRSRREFWERGAFVDLGASTDPRAHELERRVVLSQHATLTQCSGSTPPAETGLVQNSWAGTFHLEMHFWHAAHFAAWGRPELLERALRWYLQILPAARGTAARQGFPGVRWPKQVGVDGRETPNAIGPLLLWQQPHPIHLAELVRRAAAVAGPAAEAEVRARYAGLVHETAEFLAAVPVELADGRLHLAWPLVPAQETYDPRTVQDPPFEVAYTSWALEVAQQWRVAAGLPRRGDWDVVQARWADLPVHDDVPGGPVYAAVGGPPRTDLTDHPSLLAACGVVPLTAVVDVDTMRRTYHRVLRDWSWESAWGWDFPVLAMCATRLGEAGAALDALLMDTPRNEHLLNGQNCQDPVRLPLYLPGNGGLLLAVALLVGGSESSARPTLPDGWSIVGEGFVPLP